MLLAEMLSSPAGARAASRVAPYQLALGVKRGTEKMVHTCRAAFESGWIVARNDFTNGFNSLSRQAMLNAHSSFFPESTALFNFFYSIDAPFYFFDIDANLISLQSKQGPRQGCAAGTEALCLTIHPLVTALKARYPLFEFRVLTNDIIPLCPPPANPTPAAWQSLLKLYAAFLRDLEQLSATLGLCLNPGKCALLLPPNAPLPDNDTLSAFPPSFTFTQEGLVIAGAPVGTDPFVSETVKAKFLEAKAKLPAIELMGRKSPRAAHRLLTSCATKLLSYTATTVPPQFTLPFLQAFDTEICASFLRIIDPDCPNYDCSQIRIGRAALRANLNAPVGCGLFSASDQAAVTWWASVQACLDDQLFFSLRAGLTRFVQPAWTALTVALDGVTSKYWAPVAHLLPPTPVGLLDGSMFFPGAFNITKLGKLILRQILFKKRDVYVSITSFDQISDSFTQADFVIASSRSYAGSVFAEPFRRNSNQHFTSENYIAFTRFFLGLPPPPTTNVTAIVPAVDYPAQQCLVHPGMYLDAAACHATACSSAFKARNRKHNNIARVLAVAAREADLEVSREPDTHGLLLSEFSKADCKRIFPKRTSEVYKRAFDTLVATSSRVHDPSCLLTPAEKSQLLQQHIDALPIITDKSDVTGLRIDLALVNPLTNETQWIDITSVNTSAQSYVREEARHIQDHQLSSTISARHCVPTLPVAPSPSLNTREAHKREKYSRLIAVASRQVAEHRRPRQPIFSPFAVSNSGELGQSASIVQEWLVNQFRIKCVNAPARTDGLTTKDLVKDFRHRLRTEIQLAVAIGNGNLITAAGLPRGGL